MEVIGWIFIGCLVLAYLDQTRDDKKALAKEKQRVKELEMLLATYAPSINAGDIHTPT